MNGQRFREFVVRQHCVPWKLRLLARKLVPWQVRRLLTRGRVNLNTPKGMDERYCRQGDDFSTMENLYATIVPMLPATGRLLDAGCGIGVLLRAIRAKLPGLRLYGLDWSHVAVERVCGYGFEAKQVALPRVPWPDAFFDCVVSTEVLEHLEHPQDTLKAFYRALVPGGRVIVSVPYEMGPDDCAEHVHDFTEESLRRSMEQAGFEVRSINLVTREPRRGPGQSWLLMAEKGG